MDDKLSTYLDQQIVDVDFRKNHDEMFNKSRIALNVYHPAKCT